MYAIRSYYAGRYGFADDRYLDAQGMHGDVPGELFRENSRAALQQDPGLQPFAEGDAPVYRITSYNVCYTKLLRTRRNMSAGVSSGLPCRSRLR